MHLAGRPPQSVNYSNQVIKRWERRYKRRISDYLERKLYYKCLGDYRRRRWRDVMDKLSGQGKSGEIIGLSSQDHERIGQLSREQMIEVIEAFYLGAKAISSVFTYQVGTAEILGDRTRITDEMLGDLQRASNLLWNEIMRVEADKIIKSQKG